VRRSARLLSASWTVVVPVLALVALVSVWGRHPATPVVVLVDVLLAGAVLAAVHHAEVVAHRVGEPFGSIVLAVAVTVIEVGLILTLVVSGGKDTDSLARDTVFAAVMISCNGIVGISLLVVALRRHVAVFNAEGTGSALATVCTLAVLTLVLPTFTTSHPGPEFSATQLTFAALASVALYCLFILVQTVRHRDYFLPIQGDDEEAHAPPPTGRTAVLSVGLLVVSLVAIVGLAKVLTPAVEFAVARLDVPKAVVGIIIAALVLLPESLAAVRAALGNRLQTSLNLALGSALATIGLTIPAVAVVSIMLQQPLELGLDAKDQVLLAVTLLLGMITLGTGRTTVLQGIVHLVIFAVFLFFAVVP
jgi:Ca2+:H+ antiporter